MFEQIRTLTLSNVKEHNVNLLLTWLTLNLLSYLSVRIFKRYPFRIMLHRITSALAFLLAAVFAFTLEVPSKLNFF